jgi:glutathione S-transferase
MLPLATLRPAGVAAGVMAVGAAWLLRRKYSRPALRLTYLDIKSKAEPIRLALAIGGIPFEDRRVSYDQVASMRAAGELPFGQVPTLEIDGGRAHGQSLAILRWVGARAGLYPTSPSLQLDVDGAVQCLQDIQAALNPVFYRNALPRSPHTGKLYEATALSKTQCENVVDMLNRDLLPGRFAQLEAQLTRGGGPFLAGRELTMCADTPTHAPHRSILRAARPYPARPWQSGPRVLCRRRWDPRRQLLRRHLARRLGRVPAAEGSGGARGGAAGGQEVERARVLASVSFLSTFSPNHSPLLCAAASPPHP